MAKENVSSDGFFYDDASAADYYDGIITAAGYAVLLSKRVRGY